jgi:hypothetical protein
VHASAGAASNRCIRCEFGRVVEFHRVVEFYRVVDFYGVVEFYRVVDFYGVVEFHRLVELELRSVELVVYGVLFNRLVLVGRLVLGSVVFVIEFGVIELSPQGAG